MPQLVLRLSRLTDEVAERATEEVAGLVLAPVAGAPMNGSSGNGSAPRLAAGPTPLARWSSAVGASQDACLVVDPEGRIVSLSVPAADLLGCTGTPVIGRALLDVVPLVDFETGDHHPEYARRIPTLGVLASRGLMRGLLRVNRKDGQRLTIDAVAAPIHDAAGAIVGSVTFFAHITPS